MKKVTTLKPKTCRWTCRVCLELVDELKLCDLCERNWICKSCTKQKLCCKKKPRKTYHYVCGRCELMHVKVKIKKNGEKLCEFGCAFITREICNCPKKVMILSPRSGGKR